MDCKLKYSCLFICILIHGIFPVYNQEPMENQILEDYMENIASETDQEIDYEVLYEDMNYYLENPLNINQASTEELQKLHILNDFQIASLQNYIRSHGPFLSLNELQLVYGFDAETVDRIAPFITVGSAETEKIQIGKFGQHQLITRYSRVIEPAEGFKTGTDSANTGTTFQGGPAKLYTRYNYHYKDRIYWGITAEKDAGEDFFSGSNRYGYDFYSFHCLYHGPKLIKTFALGDYHINFGQGLVANSGFSLGKTPDVTNLRKYSSGISKYSSADENRYLRGVASTLRFGDMDLSLFISRKSWDANIQNVDSITGEINYTSFSTTGIHATNDEIEDENAINEKIAGVNVTLRKPNFSTGLTYLHCEWSGNYIAELPPYKQFQPYPTKQDNLGLNYQVILRRFDFFGEVAMNNEQGLAVLNGCLVTIDPMLDVSVMHRYYQRNYSSIYGNAFSESSGICNETGTYLGIRFLPFNRWVFRTYYDYFAFPWLTYIADAPSHGNEYFFEASFNTSEEVTMYWRYKLETKQVNTDVDGQNLHELGNRKLKKCRYHISYKVFGPLYMHNRIDLTEYKLENSGYQYGYMIYHDIQYRPVESPVSLYLRYSLFDIEDFNARIYTYENDVLYSCSMPFFNNRGSRFYIMGKYSFRRSLDLWIRYSQTYYPDVSSIGSGLNEIEGNTKSEIRLQVRYRF